MLGRSKRVAGLFWACAGLILSLVLGQAAATQGARVAGDGCGPPKRGEQCGPGKGLRSAGGGDKVSHKGWPAITGIFWKVTDDRGHRRLGTRRNDELLGHHGSDRISGRGGKDVIWGDWDPTGNNEWQHDVLRGGDGDDRIYTSHGRNTVLGGRGRDYIWAYYGRGTIDCGPGRDDTARVRMVNSYRIRNCERIRHFCAHGSKPGGGCYKPGERARARSGATRGGPARGGAQGGP